MPFDLSRLPCASNNINKKEYIDCLWDFWHTVNSSIGSMRGLGSKINRYSSASKHYCNFLQNFEKLIPSNKHTLSPMFQSEVPGKFWREFEHNYSLVTAVRWGWYDSGDPLQPKLFNDHMMNTISGISWRRIMKNTGKTLVHYSQSHSMYLGCWKSMKFFIVSPLRKYYKNRELILKFEDTSSFHRLSLIPVFTQYMSIEHLPLSFCLYLVLWLEDSQKSSSTLLAWSFILFTVTSTAFSSELHYTGPSEKLVLSCGKQK